MASHVNEKDDIPVKKTTDEADATIADKPYLCEVCGARFKTRPGLTHHTSEAHNINTTDNIEKKSRSIPLGPSITLTPLSPPPQVAQSSNIVSPELVTEDKSPSEGEKMDVEAKTDVQAVEIKKEIVEEIDSKIVANIVMKEEEQEQKMDVEEQQVEEKMDTPENSSVEAKKIEPKEEILSRFKLEQKDGITHLSFDGANDEDDDEEPITMSKEEVQSYLVERIAVHLKDPELSTPLKLSLRAQELQEEAKEKYDEFHKMTKLFDLLYHNQIKFLRHVGHLPKLQTNTVGISVNLPVLASALSDVPSEVQESVLKNKKEAAAQRAINITKPKGISSSTTITVVKPAPSASPGGSVTKPADASGPSKEKDIVCIDLTDESDAPPPPKTAASGSSTPISGAATSAVAARMIKHPAPLPPKPFALPNKNLPNTAPKPRLSISAEDKGIVLQWDMPVNPGPPVGYAKLSSFDIFGYQEQVNVPINTLLWKKIGSVKAMILPMACTLTQFVEGNKYHFSIRAVDVHNRCGAYSDPISIVYKQNKPKKAAE